MVSMNIILEEKKKRESRKKKMLIDMQQNANRGYLY